MKISLHLWIWIVTIFFISSSIIISNYGPNGSFIFHSCSFKNFFVSWLICCCEERLIVQLTLSRLSHHLSHLKLGFSSSELRHDVGWWPLALSHLRWLHRVVLLILVSLATLISLEALSRQSWRRWHNFFWLSPALVMLIAQLLQLLIHLRRGFISVYIVDFDLWKYWIRCCLYRVPRIR